jgi:hypothetical protein
MLEGIKERLQVALGWKYIKTFDDAVDIIGPEVSDYVDWYAERGLYLPRDYQTDPAAWTNILRKMQRAFDIASKKEYVEDESLEQEMQEGFELFGKYFYHLWR